MKIKMISVLLLLALMLSLVACGKNEGDDPVTEPVEESTTEGETIPAAKVTLSESGSTEFKIVTGKNISKALEDEALALENTLKEKSGVTFLRSDDSVSENVDYSAVYEIIFGAANRDECKEVYNSITYDGYAVKLVGKKIVLAAYSDEGLKLAREAFFNNCIRIENEGGSTKVSYVNDYVYTGEKQLFFTKDNPIESYKIVYNSSSVGFASKLCMLFEEKLGVVLHLVSDTSEPSEYEIIVGETSRRESANVYPDSDTDYVLFGVGKKLIIQTNSESMGYDLVKVFAEDFLQSAPIFNIPADVNESNIIYYAENRVELTEGADIRVMSFNILCEAWATNPDMSGRIPGVIGCILAYMPDVIGLQEVSVKWYTQLYRYLGDEYEFINADILGNKSYNYTGLAYRKSTVKLINEKLHFYSVGNNQRLRLLNMGFFEHIETGKSFIVTNTHYNANHTTVEKETQTRITQATEFSNKVSEYTNTYKCPIISTGDYNCNETTAPYKKMMESGIIFSSKLKAIEKGERATGNSIDHILYSGNITPLYFTFVVDSTVLNASDHLPLYTDFKLGD